jgi:nicotinate-nucleotide adenylyltransferase
MTRATKPIGLLGGTFNPIHLGHLRAAEELIEALDLERMIFIPSARPPHKASGDDAIAAAEDRLRWVELAIRGNPRFSVDGLELGRGGPSYSVDSLRVLRARLAPAPLVFCIGVDAFLEMGTWRSPREIFRLAHVAVASRPPISARDLAAMLPECVRGDFEIQAGGARALHREADTFVQLVSISALEISSSDLRARIRSGRSTRYLVPETVREAIESAACYAPANAAGACPHALASPAEPPA